VERYANAREGLEKNTRHKEALPHQWAERDRGSGGGTTEAKRRVKIPLAVITSPTRLTEDQRVEETIPFVLGRRKKHKKKKNKRFPVSALVLPPSSGARNEVLLLQTEGLKDGKK